jgi:hypothetical protein
VGKGGRRVELTTLPRSYADCLDIWRLSLLELQGLSRAVMGLRYLYPEASDQIPVSDFKAVMAVCYQTRPRVMNMTVT